AASSGARSISRSRRSCGSSPTSSPPRPSASTRCWTRCTPMATMTDLDRAAAVLREARDVAIACHVNPDADALGSSLGLAHHLVAGGAQVVVGFPNEPLELPVWAAALPVGDLVVPVDAFPTAPAVMVTCDCAAFDRLGVLGAAADAAAELIWIDHHRSNDGRGTIRLVDPDASSTCEVVARLLDAIGGDISDESAICLYAGLGATRDADTAAFGKQQRDGRFKVSVRSRGARDLSAVTAAFGGGGHRLAAGYTSEFGPAETIRRLRAAVTTAAPGT